MARIRSIKPEFWTSEQVMDCKAVTRLLFIGLWNFADDEGRLPFSPRTIKAQILPGDDLTPDEVREMIMELSRIGLVMIYAVEGKDYLQITGWSHQKIDKPQKPKYPAPFADESAPLPDHSTNASRTFATDRIGEDTKGEERKEDIRTVAKATRPSDAVFDEFWKVYPKRKGDNPRKTAREAFFAAVKRGADPNAIIAGVKLAAEKNRDKIGTEFIPQAVKWLRDCRWEDYQPSVVEASGFTLTRDTPRQWDAWRAYRIANGEDVKFMDAQREKGAPWTVTSEFPPDLPKQEDAA